MKLTKTQHDFLTALLEAIQRNPELKAFVSTPASGLTTALNELDRVLTLNKTDLNTSVEQFKARGSGRLLALPATILERFSLEFRMRYADPVSPFDQLPKKIVDSLCHGNSAEDMLEALLLVIDSQQLELARVMATLPIGHGIEGTETIVVVPEKPKQ